MNAPQPGTPLPWGWVSEDHSALILGGDPDYITHCVMWVSPCEACQKRNTTKQWEWGRCTTPSEQDAAYIVHACNNYPKAQALADALREAAIEVASSLAAAISLLERGGKAAKRAAPSDRMFDEMVADYKARLERARLIIAAWDAKP